MSLSLEQGRHYFRSASVEQSAAIVDARAYYQSFYRAALNAKQYMLLAGWQFDTEVALLRGEDARNANLPVTFLPFLEALCQRRPELRIYILAWDFSFVYALEREWLQDLKFATQTSDAIRFEFDTHPRYYASHHQKFVVVDGVLGFVGGMDICDERWDDRSHVAGDPLRLNAAGEPCRPNHEVQSAVVGDAAGVLSELFCQRWHAACGEQLLLPAPTPGASSDFDLAELSGGVALPLRAKEVMLSRTAVNDDGSVLPEIRTAYEEALRSAQRLIYVETQYFTSRSIAAALLARLRDSSKPKLEVIVVLPRGADSSKEKFALGETQNMVLAALEETAKTCGHELRFLCSAINGDEGNGVTFIHSKVLIIDDEFLSIGSANLTERSMGFDTELAVFWQAHGDTKLAADIGWVRASLLAEHAGQEPEDVRSPRAFMRCVDSWIAGSASRLRCCHFHSQTPNVLKTVIFDPGGPATLPSELAPAAAAFPREVDIDDASVAEDRERLARGSSWLRRELARRSVPPAADTADVSDRV
ncbi:MAG: phospholipase D-like domain-containing protein [Myxococcota bacterium]